MSLFRLDASIRTDRSASREIADIVEQEWLAAHPGDRIVRRHIGTDVLPADAWAHAVTASFTLLASSTMYSGRSILCAIIKLGGVGCAFFML